MAASPLLPKWRYCFPNWDEDGHMKAAITFSLSLPRHSALDSCAPSVGNVETQRHVSLSWNLQFEMSEELTGNYTKVLSMYRNPKPNHSKP